MLRRSLRFLGLALAAVVVALDLWGGVVDAVHASPAVALALGAPIGAGVAWGFLRTYGRDSE